MAMAPSDLKQQSSSTFPLGQPPSIEPDMPFNPFRSSACDYGIYEVCKTILMLPVCIVRFILWALFLSLGFLFSKVALLGAKDVLEKPFPLWRRKLLWPVRILARLLLFACGFQWIRIKGKAAPREEAPILVSNHVTFVDPVFLFYMHLPVAVTARENLQYPVVGAILKAMQVIAVDRISPNSRKNAAGEIKKKARCNDWSHVMIFPEATTTNGKALVSFKTGAFAPGYAVQPMVVRYPHVHLDPTWVIGGPSISLLLFRLMSQFHNFMEIEYLPVIEPTFQEQDDPRMFAERVRATMARALNVPLTEHSFGDVALIMDAQKLNASTESACLEFGRFEKLFRLEFKEIKAHFLKFNSLCVSGKGVLYFEDFISSLDFPDCPLMRDVFSYFDQPSRGYINFRQYALGISFVSKHQRFGEAIDVIFKLFDCDNDGYVKKDDVEHVFGELFSFRTSECIKRFWESINTTRDLLVNKTHFDEFLRINPEYIIIMLLGRPDVLPDHNESYHISANGRVAVAL